MTVFVGVWALFWLWGRNTNNDYVLNRSQKRRFTPLYFISVLLPLLC